MLKPHIREQHYMAQVLKRVPAALLETLCPYCPNGFLVFVVQNERAIGFTPLV